MKKQTDSTIQILEITQGELNVCIIGESPLIYNRMTNKGAQELLLPKGKKTAAEKAVSIKHDVIKEYRDSPYVNKYDGQTRLQLPSVMFKKAMMVAALDLPGAKKAQIGRLVYVTSDRIDVFGTPQMLMAITRSADINRTPDVRTRAIVPRWACALTVKFTKPMLNEQSVANCLAAGGVTAGIGDWRVEKGSGSYGRYRLCSADDPEFVALMSEGREAQDAALENPTPYDDQTADLYAWYTVEANRRGFKVVA